MPEVLQCEGMPSRTAVQVKMKRDPAFAARVNALWHRDPRGLTFDYPQHVWGAFLKNLERLGSIRAAARVDGMPLVSSVNARMKRDPAFAAQVRDLCRQLQRAPYSSATWYRFLHAHEDVGSASAVCRSPDMPSRDAFKRKRRRDPSFARRVDVVRQRHVDAARTLRGHSEETWEQLLHHLTQFGIADTCDQPGMPSVHKLQRRRRVDLEFGARVIAITRDPAYRHLHSYRYDERDWDDFLSIAAGAPSLSEACSAANMPSLTSVSDHARADAGFRAELAEIKRHQVKARIRLRLLASKPKPTPKAKRRSSEGFASALSRDELYAAVSAAVPKSLPPITRDDIICDMMLAVLEGRIEVGQIKATAKDFIREHWRMFGTLRDKSLDAALYDDGARTLGDQLAGHGADYW